MPTTRTTAAYDGIAGVVASSSAGYADILGPVRPEQHPYAAFDRSIYTAWGSAPLSSPQGEWIEATATSAYGDEQAGSGANWRTGRRSSRRVGSVTEC